MKAKIRLCRCLFRNFRHQPINPVRSRTQTSNDPIQYSVLQPPISPTENGLAHVVCPSICHLHVRQDHLHPACIQTPASGAHSVDCLPLFPNDSFLIHSAMQLHAVHRKIDAKSDMLSERGSGTSQDYTLQVLNFSQIPSDLSNSNHTGASRP